MDTTRSKTEYGLYCGDTDSSYVWAFDTCGVSVPTLMIQATDSCPPGCQPFTDPKDSAFYNTVLIGDQCWLRENLNYGFRINNSQEQTDNDTIEKYCYYNLDSLCGIYGALYQWDEMMQYLTDEGTQGVCPDGWHLPSQEEWDALTVYLGGETIAGGKMKEAGNIHWNLPNTGATNECAFTALPGGMSQPIPSFTGMGNYGIFGTGEEYINYPISSYYRLMWYNNDRLISSMGAKRSGYSVRCIKDE
jgi:uncharacterized protein (TIGR02145 family)